MSDATLSPAAQASPADLIRRRRRALPARSPPGDGWRAWAANVCQAEMEHARGDFWRIVHALGLAGLHDRDDGLGAPERAFLLAHEAHAGAALCWLAHLQAHESDRRGPWAALRWERWDAGRRRRWLERRRHLWAGFVEQMRRYANARAAIDAPRKAA